MPQIKIGHEGCVPEIIAGQKGKGVKLTLKRIFMDSNFMSYVRVCVRKRETETERQTERDTETAMEVWKIRARLKPQANRKIK